VSNWNGWRDTICCLESLFRISYVNYQVIVRDNCSEDGSIDRIKAWAEGHQTAEVDDDDPLKKYSHPAVPKPIQYQELSRPEAERGGYPEDSRSPLILIQTGANLGFAGGNNVALRYVLARNDHDYVWLLNNDTVVKADALTQLVSHMRERPRAGICGSTLVYYGAPDKIQALGGARYNAWIAKSSHIGAFQSPETPVDERAVERNMDYVVGASMLVSRAFLRDIGLMSEDYFLYCEEMDWALRGRGKYTLAFASSSIVYHKEGAVIGGSYLRPQEKSATSEYYAVRSKILLARKFFPLRLPFVYVSVMGRMLMHALRGNRSRAKLIRDILLDEMGK